MSETLPSGRRRVTEAPPRAAAALGATPCQATVQRVAPPTDGGAQQTKGDDVPRHGVVQVCHLVVHLVPKVELRRRGSVQGRVWTAQRVSGGGAMQGATHKGQETEPTRAPAGAPGRRTAKPTRMTA